ncbi:hypothetical protein XENOCAPTIV_007401 [Xenoophorus captivus]|uniref:Secreted protein n=1 Tax=Xenoophorus captivus TaxID=1517983 RepID=A0ABV0SDU8_9TELE
MLVRRRLCVIVAIAAVLLLMLASQSMQRRHILPPRAHLNSRATASTRETGKKLRNEKVIVMVTLTTQWYLSIKSNRKDYTFILSDAFTYLKYLEVVQNLCFCLFGVMGNHGFCRLRWVIVVPNR